MISLNGEGAYRVRVTWDWYQASFRIFGSLHLQDEHRPGFVGVPCATEGWFGWISKRWVCR